MFNDQINFENFDEDFLEEIERHEGGTAIYKNRPEEFTRGTSEKCGTQTSQKEKRELICDKSKYLTKVSKNSEGDDKQEFLKAWKCNNICEDTEAASSSKPTESLNISLGFKKQIRARKFPGPAGLLPERQPNTPLVAMDEFLSELDSESNDLSFNETEVLSQTSGNIWEKGAWGRLVEALGVDGQRLLSSINLRSIRATAKHSRCTKVPFLAVLLQHIDCSSPDPSLILKDTTGEMSGALHREVLEKWGDDLVPGCVLVLRSVGVIRAGLTSRRHFLNITANNIASIYTVNNDDDEKVIAINPIKKGDCAKIMEEWEGLLAAPPSSQVPLSPPRLYTSVTESPPPRQPSPWRGRVRAPLPPPHPNPRPRLFMGLPTPPPPRNFPQQFPKRPRMEPLHPRRPQPSSIHENIFPDDDNALFDSLLEEIDNDSLCGNF